MEEMLLQPDEKKLIVLRKHWLVFLGNFIPFLLLALLPFIVIGFLSSGISGSGMVNAISFEQPWVKFVVGIYWLFLWLETLSNFIRFYFDMWIVTNLRIIDIEQHNFFDREVNSLFLNSAEDVTVEESGFFQTTFNFGNILVQTAGAAQKTIFPSIPNPKAVRDLIMQNVRVMDEIKPDPNAKQVKREIYDN